MCHSSAISEKLPNLVTLHKGKWEENGTITENRSQTVHEPLENPDTHTHIYLKIFKV